MSEGWGQDFDEDGNIIGEVPDDDAESALEKHKYKIAFVSLFWFIISVLSQGEITIGAIIGGGVASVIVGSALVFAGVWVYGKFK